MSWNNLPFKEFQQSYHVSVERKADSYSFVSLKAFISTYFDCIFKTKVKSEAFTPQVVSKLCEALT